MKLLYVTDNGFAKSDKGFTYSAPNYAHIEHLKRYFSSFVIVARNNCHEKGYTLISKDISHEVYLFDRKDISSIRRCIKEQLPNVDAVMCYGTNGYFASSIARKYNKVVISYSGGDVFKFLLSRHNLKGFLLAPIGLYTHKEMFKNSDFGHYCDEFLFKRYPANGRMMACSGVSIEYTDTNLKNRLEKIKLFDVSGNIKLGLIGHTLNNLKGIDVAIKALAELPKKYTLEIVGRGEHSEYDMLAKKLGCFDQVIFLGTLAAGDEIFTWLDNIDIYIQPSRIEGLPRATIEAMSRGCPIVASNTGAMGKLIDDEFIVPIEDPQALAEKIRLISQYKNMEKYARQNFERAYEYSTEVRDRKYDDFYGAVLAEINRRKGINNEISD